MKLHNKYSSLVSYMSVDEQISAFNKTIKTDMDNDIVKWKLGELDVEILCERYNISRRTLTRKYNEFKSRYVAVCLVERLVAMGKCEE